MSKHFVSTQVSQLKVLPHGTVRFPCIALCKRDPGLLDTIMYDAWRAKLPRADLEKLALLLGFTLYKGLLGVIVNDVRINGRTIVDRYITGERAIGHTERVVNE